VAYPAEASGELLGIATGDDHADAAIRQPPRDRAAGRARAPGEQDRPRQNSTVRIR
jgi:hypothetical protein